MPWLDGKKNMERKKDDANYMLHTLIHSVRHERFMATVGEFSGTVSTSLNPRQLPVKKEKKTQEVKRHKIVIPERRNAEACKVHAATCSVESNRQLGKIYSSQST